MRKKEADQRATYKVPEAAKVAGCGQKAIRDAVRDGRIRTLKLGGGRNILIPKNAFHEWLDSCGERATA
jgi:excisionase family DNA binding protein